MFRFAVLLALLQAGATPVPARDPAVGVEYLRRVIVIPVMHDVHHQIAVAGLQPIGEEVSRFEDESVDCRSCGSVDDAERWRSISGPSLSFARRCVSVTS
jgi:hypothetical protein